MLATLATRMATDLLLLAAMLKPMTVVVTTPPATTALRLSRLPLLLVIGALLAEMLVVAGKPLIHLAAAAQLPI
jgi:hypothetical protein